MKTIELFIPEDLLDFDGVFGIGLVGDPAIESKGVYMNKAQKMVTMSLQEEKQMFYSALMIPDKMVLRYDEMGNPFNVFFSRETIEKLQRNFNKNFNQMNFTYEHKSQIEGAIATEQWIKMSDVDKSVEIGLQDVPNGSWIVGVHLTNTELIDKIKKGDITGLSIEAMMAEKIINNSTQTPPSIIEQIQKIVDNQHKVEKK